MMQGQLALMLSFAILWMLPVAEAQQAGKVWRIGVLMPERTGALEALVEGLRELDYVEGRNLVLEHRHFTRSDEMPALATELVRLNPHVIVAGAGRAALALKAVTKTVPIVMANSNDAIAQGLVASLARPGGNVTGFTLMSPELAAKRLQVLTEAAPRAVRIGVLGCPDVTPESKAEWSGAQSAGQRLGLHLVPIVIRRPEEFSRVFENEMRQQIEAILVFDCGSLPRGEQVTGLVNKYRVPAMYPFARYAQAGGLMSYGPNTIENYRRAAIFVDKILKGAKPAELPVEQPTKFELVINLNTAKALGFTIPQSLLVRADQVIE
jgi:putative ABC transport system substrate-binding protein